MMKAVSRRLVMAVLVLGWAQTASAQTADEVIECRQVKTLSDLVELVNGACSSPAIAVRGRRSVKPSS
jgi:hypothetical protein